MYQSTMVIQFITYLSILLLNKLILTGDSLNRNKHLSTNIYPQKLHQKSADTHFRRMLPLPFTAIETLKVGSLPLS